MQIGDAHHVDAGLVEHPARTEALVEIAKSCLAVFWQGVLSAGGLGMPAVVERAIEAVPELGDFPAEGEKLRCGGQGFVGDRGARA